MPLTFPLLPSRLSGLADVAGNLAWSWNRDARALFRTVDEQLWMRCRFDPIRLLRTVSPERLAQCATDRGFLDRYDRMMRWFDDERSAEQTWFARMYPTLRGHTVAYFCAEFGFYHSVPIYSGGLGVLAGDHCKTASDLGVPLVGVGILYRAGYFDQRMRIDGWQEESDNRFDLADTPLEPVTGPGGEPHIATVQTAGRDICIRAWRLKVGRVPVYLLDSDLPENHAADRPLLSKLYTGGPELRLRQEWLLGVGGVRVLRALGFKPSAWHANEGHAAFMLIERLREELAAGVSLKDATSRVRATSVFTTHTPVPAGHDVFSTDLVTQCIEPVWNHGGVSREAVMRFGYNPASGAGAFDMTAAAVRLSSRVNAVSRSHGAVTRHIWSSLWPDRREDEVPIRHVTNGVHVSTWMANAMIALLDEHLGEDWGGRANDPALWERVLTIDDAALWGVHQQLKLTLLSLAREEARRAFAARMRDTEQLVGSGLLLEPAVLTIGFARRFATYKRANLVFHDVERLLRIVTDPARPVQIVFAGKAHPADGPGKRVLQEVYRTTQDPRFEGRIAFVENYDMLIAHMLVQGTDLWLNVPRVPMEASGTSGMKAALNGVPQLSTSDGWWAEGYNGHNGWTITTPAFEADSDAAVAHAAEQFYSLLEQAVVPSYYERDGAGLPSRWLPMMKQAIRVAGLQFTSLRMVTEYVRGYYVPSMNGDVLHDEAPL